MQTYHTQIHKLEVDNFNLLAELGGVILDLDDSLDEETVKNSIKRIRDKVLYNNKQIELLKAKYFKFVYG